MKDYLKVKSDDPYIHTWSGHRFHFLNPTVDTVCIEDVAHALSLQARFNGHTTELYSVAAHSLVVADLVAQETDDPRIILAALMHDAAEAYLGDIVSPLKWLLPDYRQYERAVEECIAKKFDLIYPFPPAVHTADMKALEQEFDSLPPYADRGKTQAIQHPWDVESQFLTRFHELKGEIENG